MQRKYTVVVCIVLAIVLAFTAYRTKQSIADVPPALPRIGVLIDPYVNAGTNPHLQALLAEYQTFLQNGIDQKMSPGMAVAIVQDTTILYLKGFGLRDASHNDSINIHTLFRIGSVSKCFASMLTGLLVDEGRLNWDDPVIKYVPDFKLKSKEHTEALTLRHVLSHTTGLPYHAFTDRVDEGANFDTLLYHLRDLDLYGKPGQFYSYQNVGYSLISKVVAGATGKSYEQNLREKIFEPLKMGSASTSYAAIMNNTNVAVPHRFTNRWRPVPISTTYYDVAPAGGINASISDMARWLRSVTSNPPQLLKKATEDEIFHPFVRAIARNNNFLRWKPVRSSYYALGWRVINFRDDTLNYHGGFVNNYRSEVAIDRKDKVAICVLVNAPGGIADVSVPMFFQMYGRYRKAIREWELQRSMAPIHQP